MADQQTVDGDLAALRTQVEDANKRTAAANEEAGKLRARITDEVGARVKADETAAVAAIAGCEQEIANLETQLAAAMEAKDALAMSKATRLIASSQNKLDGWTARRSQIDRFKTDAVKRLEAEARAPKSTAPQYTPATAKWLSDHPEVANSPAMMNKAFAYHNIAVADGLVPETPAYFKFVEERLLGPKPQRTEEVEDATVVDTAPPAREAPVEPPARVAAETRMTADTAAAPSRPNGRMNGGGKPSEIRLSASEVEIARISYKHLPPDEQLKAYAKAKSELIAEGRLTA